MLQFGRCGHIRKHIFWAPFVNFSSFKFFHALPELISTFLFLLAKQLTSLWSSLGQCPTILAQRHSRDSLELAQNLLNSLGKKTQGRFVITLYGVALPKFEYRGRLHFSAPHAPTAIVFILLKTPPNS